MKKDIDVYDLSDDAIKFFIKEVKYWQSQLGLEDWDIYVDVCDKKTNLQGVVTLAETFADRVTGSAEITLYKNWPIEPTAEEMKKTANHEILELLLWNLAEMARVEFSNKKIVTEKHKIINQLQKHMI